MQVNTWEKCYESGWKDIIVPEAFSHPAKMAYGLLKRILVHAKEREWLYKGSVILDPFGGIGSTGILGAYEGYQVVCCELEAKFCKLAEQNFKLHENALEKLGCSFPIILQGDSRRLCEVVEKADCIVSSPPYAGALGNRKHEGDQQKYYERQKKYNESHPEHKRPSAESMCYPCSEGNLAGLKPGNVDMVVSSPPYAESLKGDGTQSETAKESRDKRRTPGGSLGQSQRTQGYGSKGNLGNLKSGDVDCVISSPPFEKTDQRGAEHSKRGNYFQRKSGKPFGAGQSMVGYPKSQGQLGQEQGDTFWQAAKIIVEQCHQILKPGGHAIWVVKSFVRNKRIVDFPGDWQRLCEAAGFKTVCVHHAMLVKETEHQTLFGHTEVKRKERKSFFRRLAESKGSPRIDYEVVLCMSKATK